jgi:alpha-1,4-digalacturonate transport system substrate-binding protein
MQTQISPVRAAVQALAAMAFGFAATQAYAGDVRVMCYQDGIECNVLTDQAKRFEAANPGTKIIIDVVPYRTIVEQLPVQLAAGQGPDIARVTDLGGLSKYYLDISPHVKDRKHWDTNYGATAAWLRPTPQDNGIYGFMSQLTVTGPYVNKTLFEQAKVAMPGPKATWEEWVDATRRVARATNTKAAMAWDRSGHRTAGPAISYGAKIFDAKGELVIDDGYKTFVNKFVNWHKDGTMLKEIWAGTGGGSGYGDSVGEFVNGNVVMVLSGSWQINRLQRDVGNKFDWVAVPNPCGPAACSGIPGGAAWVALKTSKSPKETGAFLDFLASDAAYAEFAGLTSNIPAHVGLAGKLNYTNAQPAARAALTAFSSGVASLAPAAFQFQGYKFNRAMMLPTVTRVTQAIVGEMSTDEAVSKIAADMADAVKQAQK